MTLQRIGGRPPPCVADTAERSLDRYAGPTRTYNARPQNPCQRKTSAANGATSPGTSGLGSNRCREHGRTRKILAHDVKTELACCAPEGDTQAWHNGRRGFRGRGSCSRACARTGEGATSSGLSGTPQGRLRGHHVVWLCFFRAPVAGNSVSDNDPAAGTWHGLSESA